MSVADPIPPGIVVAHVADATLPARHDVGIVMPPLLVEALEAFRDGERVVR